jgi:hypothetical protein
VLVRCCFGAVWVLFEVRAVIEKGRSKIVLRPLLCTCAYGLMLVVVDVVVVAVTPTAVAIGVAPTDVTIAAGRVVVVVAMT